MNYPQVLVYESDGRLAAQLAGLWDEQRWAVREPRDPAACLRLLRGGGPGVLVVRVGRSPPHGLEVLDAVQAALPDVPAVAVTGGDGPDPALAGLCWDLGARAVLEPPLPDGVLREVVAGLMRSAADAAAG